MLDIQPDYTNLKIGDEGKTVSPEEVKIGDIIIVKTGEKVYWIARSSEAGPCCKPPP